MDQWLPMADVVARTGLSQRTVYRMASQGRLQQAQRRIPGRRPLAVFSPESVSEIVASTGQPSPKPQARSEPAADGVTGSVLPPSELSFKLYLNEEEAIRYTGFGRAWIRVHGKGRPIGPHGAVVYRRVDLEKL
jgi:predicted DNA-binding transcriptional regulator AlpA